VKQKVTLKDVAQLAGVSVATASYVLNRSEKQHISKETRARVREAARQLSYMPNTSAKSLKSNQSGCIGVAIDKNITIPRYAQTLQGIRYVLAEHGYQLMLCSTRVIQGEYPDYIRCYFSRSVDGIIYIGADNAEFPLDAENTIIRYGIPVVTFDCGDSREISSVELDYFAGAYELGLYLMERGVRRIHYIRPAVDRRQERQREQGILRVSYARPELDLVLHRLHIQYSNGNMQIFQSNSSLTEKTEFQEYAQAIRDCVASFADELAPGADKGSYGDTAIICSWAAMEQHVCAALERYPFRPRIGVLAQGLLFPGSYPYITYSELPNYEAGCACARQILHLLDHPDAVEHLVLKPSISEAQNVFEKGNPAEIS